MTQEWKTIRAARTPSEPWQGGRPRLLASSSASPWPEAIAIDATYVYFTALLNPDAEGTDTILRVAK